MGDWRGHLSRDPRQQKKTYANSRLVVSAAVVGHLDKGKYESASPLLGWSGGLVYT